MHHAITTGRNQTETEGELRISKRSVSSLLYNKFTTSRNT